MDENVETKGTTRGLRWPWEKLGKAKTADEVKAAVAGGSGLAGDGGHPDQAEHPPQGYLRLMGDAWLAWQYGEIERPGTKELLDRALAVYCQLYLGAILQARRERAQGARPG